jgi:hypothetical protein
MIVEWKGKTFQLSGFTDAERTLVDVGAEGCMDVHAWAVANPEAVVPNDIEAIHFPRGSQVTFKYRELTDDGIPKEASYMRRFFV